MPVALFAYVELPDLDARDRLACDFAVPPDSDARRHWGDLQIVRQIARWTRAPSAVPFRRGVGDRLAADPSAIDPGVPTDSVDQRDHSVAHDLHVRLAFVHPTIALRVSVLHPDDHRDRRCPVFAASDGRYPSRHANRFRSRHCRVPCRLRTR